MTRSPLLRVAAGTVVAGVLVVTCLGAPTSTAAETGGANPNNYTLSAAANSVDVVLDDLSAPLITEYEASPYGASATLNSLGQSSSDAGAPYSPTVSGLPPLLAGLAPGQVPPLPPLPGYVAANFPGTAAAAQKQGPYSIQASASQYDSHSQVALGVGLAGASGSRFSASAETTANSDGSVTVAASTGVDLLNIGGLIDIGNITSRAQMTLTAGGTPQVTQSISLGTISVLGTTTGILGTQLKILGNGVDIPLTSTLITALNTLLKPGGISLTQLPAKYTYTDGTSSVAVASAGKVIQAVDTGALQLTMTEDVATQGTVKLAVTIGRVTVSAMNAPGFAPGSGTGETGGGSSTGLRGLGEPGSGVVPGPLPNVVAPSIGPLVATSAPPVVSPTGSVPSRRTITLGFNKEPSAAGAYLLLVLAALAAVGGSVLIRILGVRVLMNSFPWPATSRVRMRRTGAQL